MPKVLIQGSELNYEIEGSGVPILVISGWVRISASSDRYRRIFGDTHKLIRPELRGMGQTDAANGAVTMEYLAEDIKALLDHLGLENIRVLGGGGTGAQVAIVLASRYPEKVRSLVLGAPVAKADPFYRELLNFWADLYRASPALWARDITLHEYAAETWNERPEIVASAIAARTINDPFASADAYAELVKACVDFDGMDMLPKISCPTLVTCGGDEDRITGPRYARAVQSRIPGASIHVFDGAAHGYQTEAFEQFSSVVRDWFARN